MRLRDYEPRLRLKAYMLFALGLIYAGFSSSTPDAIGLPELLIGLLLALIVGLSGPISLTTCITASTRTSILLPILQVSFLYLCIVPTVYGLAFNQVELMDWVRDIIPLFYMFLPVLWIPLLRQHPLVWAQIIAYVLTLIGTLFAIRFFLIDDVSILNLGRAVMFGDMNYFPMDPAVTFTAVFALLEGFRALENRSIRKALLWFMLSTICIASLAAMMVRAPLILYSIVLMTRVLTLKSAGILGAIVQTVTLFTFLFILALAAPVFELLVAKMEATGLNAKDAEIRTLIELAFSNPIALLFGTGWGGTFLSPAVGVHVRFIHNFAGYFFLKAGIFGLLISTLVILRTYPSLAYRWLTSNKPSRRSHTRLSSVHAACFVVLSSSFFLQANFKSLSFGLVLTIAMLSIGLFQLVSNKATQSIHTSSNNREDHSNRSDIQ